MLFVRISGADGFAIALRMHAIDHFQSKFAHANGRSTEHMDGARWAPWAML